MTSEPPTRRDGWRSTPHPRRLSEQHPHRAEILAQHEMAMERGVPVYADPVSALSVFTADFLDKRNHCCDSGCRHCPYVT